MLTSAKNNLNGDHCEQGLTGASKYSEYTRRCTRKQGMLLHSLFSEILKDRPELIAESFDFENFSERRGCHLDWIWFLVINNRIFIRGSWALKFHRQVQFLVLIPKMQISKRFSIFVQHREHLKFQEIIAIDKNSQAPSCQEGGHTHEEILITLSQ